VNNSCPCDGSPVGGSQGGALRIPFINDQGKGDLPITMQLMLQRAYSGFSITWGTHCPIGAVRDCWKHCSLQPSKKDWFFYSFHGSSCRSDALAKPQKYCILQLGMLPCILLTSSNP